MKQTKMSITTSPFGITKDGTEVQLFTCRNKQGLLMKLTNFGATVVSLETPDRDGKLANINLGFSSLDGYLGQHPYFGATVGRYCNRIARGKFSIDGKTFTLATNNGPNHLHGGNVGFNRVVWKPTEVTTDAAVGVRFDYASKDGEEGYPGNLDVTVEYMLTHKNELRVDFTATSDAKTPVNLTNHNYWNLAGAGSGMTLNHEVTIEADQFLPVDPTLIPTGEKAPVKGTPLDFTTAHKIGERIEEIEADPAGYDHCFVLRNQTGALELAATVKDAASGRVMKVFTTQPGIQFYSANFLDGSEANGGNKRYEAFCLETQHYPDSPNQPSFPSSILEPGETFRQTTVHRFLTDSDAET